MFEESESTGGKTTNLLILASPFSIFLQASSFIFESSLPVRQKKSENLTHVLSLVIDGTGATGQRRKGTGIKGIERSKARYRVTMCKPMRLNDETYKQYRSARNTNCALCRAKIDSTPPTDQTPAPIWLKKLG